MGYLLFATSTKSLVSESVLTKEEARMFKRIAKVDPSFHYTDKARRYFHKFPFPDSDIEIPIHTKLAFAQPYGLYFDKYISYSVEFDLDASRVTYHFDGGTSNRGTGTYFVTPKAVIQIERGCGVTACITRIYRNGKLLHDEEG